MTDSELMQLIACTTQVIEKSKSSICATLYCNEAEDVMRYIVMKELAEELLAARKIIINQSLKEASC